MPRGVALSFSLSVLLGRAAFAQTTQPSVAPTTEPFSSIGTKEFLSELARDAAGAYYYDHQYEVALPLLQQAVAVTTDPERLASLQEKIRVCRRNIAAGTTSKATPDQRAIPTSAETRVPHTVPTAATTLDISIKELGNFDYDEEKGGDIPADVKALAGSRIRLRGYMIPVNGSEKVTQFVLVPNQLGPDAGPAPSIQNMAMVSCPKDKPLSYSPDEIVVEGTLTIDEKKDNGFIVSIFEIACSSVRPAPK